MMQLKQMSIALITAGVLSANAYANEAAIEPIGAQPQAAFTETDLSALFEQDAKPMQLAALSGQEMGETEGAWWPVVYRLGGGLAGMYGAGYGYLASGGRDHRGFLNSVATGFASGVWSPTTGFGSASYAFTAGAASGSVNAFGARLGWW